MNKASQQILTRITCSAVELEKYLDCWEDLAKNAAEPNIFYEPGPLLAALKNADDGLSFICLLIFRKAILPQNNEEQLIGLFPFQYLKETQWPSCGVYQTFTHRHCYLSTPLVHKEHIPVALDCFFDWANSSPNSVKLFRLHRTNGTGTLAEAFQCKLKKNRQPAMREGSYQRAFISPTGKAEEYISNALSKHKHKEYGRLYRRLEEQGTLKLETNNTDEQFKWLDKFLSLEASGWKGSKGRAMECNGNDSGFFYDLIRSLSKKKQLVLHSLWLDKHVIAMKCNLISCDMRGTFAFKIAYDENYSKFSPGVLLELKNIHHLFKQSPPLAWIDSCADPDHPMIDQLWKERRTIDDYFIGTKTFGGRIKILLLKIQKRLTQIKAKRNNDQ